MMIFFSLAGIIVTPESSCKMGNIDFTEVNLHDKMISYKPQYPVCFSLSDPVQQEVLAVPGRRNPHFPAEYPGEIIPVIKAAFIGDLFYALVGMIE